jgi:hypothetical protein
MLLSIIEQEAERGDDPKWLSIGTGRAGIDDKACKD